MFMALHQHQIEEIDRLVNTTIVLNAHSPVEKLIRAVMGAMVDEHATDPEFSGAMFSEIPHRPEGTHDFAIRLHDVFRLTPASKARELKRHRDLDKAVFVVANMIEALAHGAVLRRPPGLSLGAPKQEAVRAVPAYLKE
jgi:hypothetical protein